MTELELSISVDDTRALVEASGEVDMATAQQLLDAILSAHDKQGQDVTLDLSGVSFMDSRGVSTLIEAHTHLAGHDCRLRIENARPTVAAILAMTGVAAYLDPADEAPPS